MSDLRTMIDGKRRRIDTDHAAIERQKARLYAYHQFQATEHARASFEVADLRLQRAAQPVTSDMPDAFLRELADRRAELMAQRITDRTAPSDAAGFVLWVNAQTEPLQGRALALDPALPETEALAGIIGRVQCAAWWRRQLRRAAVRAREGEGIARHEVCATRRQPYVTTDTLRRRIEQNARNASMLAATELESADGQVFTIEQLAATSTSNKGIRRGELMTRIKGCEQIADEKGDRGVFLTLTAPSRFHSTLRHGEPNPRHNGSTPREAQAWLVSTWAKARARLDRIGVMRYGFRVAEPHHDGCPHWHLLLWAPAGHLWRLVLNLKRWWLRDGPREAGAREHRCKAVLMERGGALGYVAKYIAKNIDDAGAVGVEGHTDEYNGEAVPMPAQADMFGGTAQRVEAWAAAWGIRQFQAIGQPPVTVWRELRRIEFADVLAASKRVCRAWVAAHREDEQRADWAAYVTEQGGVCMGRFRSIDVASVTALKHGRYESAEVPRPVGVTDRADPARIVPSNRREWRPKGTWAKGERRAPKAPGVPRTRFNNCTRPTVIAGRLQVRGAPLRTWRQVIGADNEHPGAGFNRGTPPCEPPRPSPPTRPSESPMPSTPASA